MIFVFRIQIWEMMDTFLTYGHISSTKKSTIVTNITDTLSDYGTPAAAARKQIENFLIKSGETSFGSGSMNDIFELRTITRDI